MKTPLLLFLALILAPNFIVSQTVIGERTAELMEGGYTISGTATILEYDDGTVTFELSDDFETPAGPDVRIYLNDAFNADGAVELVNLATINHFSGALTVEVPEGTDLEVNDKVVFYCFAFSALWATGEFGDVTNPGGTADTCRVSSTATTDWVTQVDLCTATDGPQEVELRNNIGETPGEKYAYLLTDTNELLLEVVLDSVYTFGASIISPLRVYGISYRGALEPSVGENRHNTTATGCFIHSGNDLFLTVSPRATCVPSRVAEQLSSRTQLFPNPAQQQIKLQYPPDFRVTQLEILNHLGQSVQKLSGAQATNAIQLTGLRAGQYVLVATNSNGLSIRKLFVKL